MTVIGEDSSERLDVIPAQFRVIVTKRPKLACRARLPKVPSAQPMEWQTRAVQALWCRNRRQPD
jgi:transposase